MTKKNYNRLALQGMDISDMDFVQEFGLDPRIAHTPEINDAMLNLIYQQNVKGFMEMGDKENIAKTKAGRLRAEAKAEIESLM
jgi:hypothetical protein